MDTREHNGMVSYERKSGGLFIALLTLGKYVFFKKDEKLFWIWGNPQAIMVCNVWWPFLKPHIYKIMSNPPLLGYPTLSCSM